MTFADGKNTGESGCCHEAVFHKTETCLWESSSSPERRQPNVLCSTAATCEAVSGGGAASVDAAIAGAAAAVTASPEKRTEGPVSAEASTSLNRQKKTASEDLACTAASATVSTASAASTISAACIASSGAFSCGEAQEQGIRTKAESQTAALAAAASAVALHGEGCCGTIEESLLCSVQRRASAISTAAEAAADAAAAAEEVAAAAEEAVAAAEEAVAAVAAAAAASGDTAACFLAENRCRPSKLDFLDPESDLAKSEFRGVGVLIFVAALFFLIVNPILRWYESKEFVDPSLAEAMFKDFLFLMLMWAKLFAWSFTAYYLHVLYMKGRIRRATLLLMQHATQLICIAYAVGSCLYKEWPIIPAGFVQLIAVVQFMKMHSYTCINLEFNDEMKAGVHVEGYPANINIKNFCDYLLCPVLVYAPVYARGAGFRPAYFVCKLFSMVGAMVAMYLLCTSYLIGTIIRSPTTSLTEAIISLVFPFLFLGILIFYIIFECICNLAAEVTNFAQRDFYGDWWNSRNWDEYSRKWNRPVHRFLLRHVYMETQQKYRWNQQTASFVTFLFSALLHEMILAVCFRIVRLYLFALMLLQIPLIALGRYYRHKKLVANGFFWACMMLGPPLLAVAYGREWAQVHYFAARADHQELRLF